MSYMSGLMLGTAIVQGLGSILSGGSSGGMGGMGRGTGMGGLFGMAAAGMGRGAVGGMGRSSGLGGLFSMAAGTGRSMGSGGMFGRSAARGAGRGRGMEQGTQEFSTPAAPAAAALPAFSLKSAALGRRRYYIAALQDNAELAKLLEKNLSRIAWIDSVKATSLTGSLLISYTGSEAEMDRLMAEIGRRVFGVQPAAVGFPLPQAAPSPALPAAGAPQPLAELGASIRRTVGTANAWLRSKTFGWLDFPSIVALGFIARGLRKILLYNQRPSGPQMLWWAFSLLKGWKML